MGAWLCGKRASGVERGSSCCSTLQHFVVTLTKEDCQVELWLGLLTPGVSVG